MNNLEQEAFNKIKKLSDDYKLDIRDEDAEDWMMRLQTTMGSPDVVAESIRSVLTSMQSNDMQKVLNDLEISVVDAEGSMKSATEVFADLNSKWKSVME